MKDLDVLIIRILYKISGKLCIPVLVNRFIIIMIDASCLQHELG